jgi:RNA polymerase sigma-70 factor, ECF subfamily
MTERSESQEPCDGDLIARVRGGDVQAYGVLVQRYERGALAAALPVVRGDLHTAQDVVQNVFVACYLQLHTLRDGSRFAGWLMRSARREAVRAARRRRRLPLVSDPPDVRIEPPPIDEDQQQLLDCVRRLPDHEQLVVSMRFFDGHEVAEIARLTGRPVGTVTKQLSRAIERLRGQLNSVENRSCPNPSKPSIA